MESSTRSWQESHVYRALGHQIIIKILGPLWFAENTHTHYICWIDSFFGDDESGVRTLLQIDSQEEFSIFFKSL